MDEGREKVWRIGIEGRRRGDKIKKGFVAMLRDVQLNGDDEKRVRKERKTLGRQQGEMKSAYWIQEIKVQSRWRFTIFSFFIR